MSDVHLDLWYGENQQVPRSGFSQHWFNIVGRVAPVDRIETLRYRLNSGTWNTLSTGPDYRRLTGHGDFNIELDRERLQSGDNTVTISASTSDGIDLNRQVRVYNPDQTLPMLPLVVDWSQDTQAQEAVQIVDGFWRVSDGHLWTVETGYDRAVAVGSIALESYAICVPITLYGFAASGSAPMSGGYGLGVALHWQGHVDWGADAYASGQPRHGYEPIGAMAWYGWDRAYGFRLRLEGHDASTALATHSDFQMRFGQEYIFKMQVKTHPNLPCSYALKVWPNHDPEPSQWMLEASGSRGELKSGSALLLAHHTVCRFGTIEVSPVEK